MPSTPQDHKPKQTKKPNKAPKAKPSTGDRQYGAGWGTEELFDLEVPSGTVVQVRKIEPEELLSEGLLDQFDAFTSTIATVTIPKAKGSPKTTVDVAKLLEDPKKVEDMIAMLDKVTLMVVTQPEIFPVPEPDQETGRVNRVSGRIYIDKVRLEDKAFIMSYAVGEVGDLDEFRARSGEAVADLSAVPVAELQAK